jgi:hexosaminidase
LKQLLFSAHKTDGLIHKQLIRDYPRYRWRGLHLDVSRHIFEPAFIKQYLKLMSELKLNKFHWHLTDDQGWRIESKRYPLLQEISAWRKEADGERYGGYYTQGEIRDVVAYATELGIEVIPELDLPGHMMAVLSAYPQLACNPQAFDTMNVWGISEDILCAGKDSTRDFILDIVDEVAELFPGAYFHLGGDEAPKDRWKACPYCQKRRRPAKLAL